MNQQPDSLHVAPAQQPAAETTAAPQPQPEAPVAVEAEEPVAEQKHPYQVLRELPEDATPVQQDSALQSVYLPKKTHTAATTDSVAKTDSVATNEAPAEDDVPVIPLYYKETYFSNDSLYHPELSAGRRGVAGEPVPYTVSGDDVITSLLLGCVVLTLLAFAHLRRFIARQAKDFFSVPNAGATTEVTETAGEVRFQLLLVVQTALLAAIIAFFYVQAYVTDDLLLRSDYTLIWIFLGCLVGYFLVKAGLYGMVNLTFFDQARCMKWQKTLLLISCAEGILLLPLVLLQTFFGLTIRSALIYAGVVIVVAKAMAFYKAYSIFFRQKGFRLQIILYLCALEIVPLLFLWGILWTIVDSLRIKS